MRNASSLPLGALPRRGGAPRSLLIVVALLGVGVAVYLRPWSRTGADAPPIPTIATASLEAPLAAVIEARVAALRAAPSDAQAWGSLGEVCDVHELFVPAEACYARAAQLDPKAARWPYLRGLLLRIGDRARAAESFRAALAIDPSLAAAHFHLAHLELAAERGEVAREHFERALSLVPAATAGRIGLAQVELAAKQPRKALEQLELARQIDPNSAEARWLCAAAWRALGDEDKASEYAGPGEAQPRLEGFPDLLRDELMLRESVSLDLVIQKADLLLRRGKPADARAALAAYLEQVPRSARALIALADAYLRDGQPDEAIPRYQAALTIEPNDATAHALLGNALFRVDKRQQATQHFRRALELEPGKVDALSNLGGILATSSEKSEREEGITLLVRAVAARPDDAGLRMNLGRALQQAGRGDEAIAAFDRALELAPLDPRAHFEAGLVCAVFRKLEPAAVHFARAVELEPSRPEARSNLIEALMRLGRHADAVAAIRAGLERAPKDRALRGQLAWILATSPDERVRSGHEAVEIARALSAEAEDHNPELMLVLGAALAETGDFEAGAEVVESALRILQPQQGRTFETPGEVAIIERALACRKLFAEKKPFRGELPP